MRDRRFVAEHRGGPLKKDQHYQCMEWACDCAEHVMPLLANSIDKRLTNALMVAKNWTLGKASVGEAMKASQAAHAAARDSEDLTAIFVARSIGQAVATAHMADHSLGAAWYGLKAVKNAGLSVESERKWQDSRLAPEIKELVISARKNRNI